VAAVVGIGVPKRVSIYGHRYRNRIVGATPLATSGHQYEKVFDEETQQLVGKETGETAHMEPMKQHFSPAFCLGDVRETLSFSQSDFGHQIVTEMFIVTDNLSCITS
jgi:hypothetical protein